MRYDDASWHCGGNFPPGSPEEYGGTHIALFLKWCFIKGWAGQLHTDDEPEDTQKVIDGSLSATEYFFRYCDGKLTNEDLNQTGNAFAEQYYGDDGLYLEDYAKYFPEHLYVAPESAHDFERFSSALEIRLKTGVLTTRQVKPWWKIW